MKIKKTLNVTRLRTEPQHLQNLEGEEVLRLVHDGSPDIKVVITMEYFFYLINQDSRARYLLDGEELVGGTPLESWNLTMEQRMQSLRERFLERERLRTEDRVMRNLEVSTLR